MHMYNCPGGIAKQDEPSGKHTCSPQAADLDDAATAQFHHDCASCGTCVTHKVAVLDQHSSTVFHSHCTYKERQAFQALQVNPTGHASHSQLSVFIPGLKGAD